MFKNNLKISPNLIEFFLKTTFAFTVGITLLDVFKYFGFVENHFKISTFIVVTIMTIVHLAIRFKFSMNLGESFSKTMITLFFPITLITSFIMFYLEEFGHLYPNYFFSEFNIQYGSLSVVSFAFLVFGLVHSTKTLWQKNYKIFNFIISLGLLIGSIFFSLKQPEVFIILRMEDGLIEILQALLFAFSGIICWKLRKKAINFLQDSKIQ